MAAGFSDRLKIDLCCDLLFHVVNMSATWLNSQGSCSSSLAGSHSPARLASLEEFGHRAYNIALLRDDLDRFTFLLGGSDGEPSFGA